MEENRLAQNNEILHKTYRHMATLETIYSIRTRLFAVELSITY
ncbi:hypothetical protein T05_4575 [Trichinella murrelli]|uniref:Uncharacterized protein n=1 Tax=Trichinella murrelli TaxID=144512 RepID=A0A0V0T5D5_9BILA|nr:hypothetical protein T05_4575 [Trichinella murrelli]